MSKKEKSKEMEVWSKIAPVLLEMPNISNEEYVMIFDALRKYESPKEEVSNFKQWKRDIVNKFEETLNERTMPKCTELHYEIDIFPDEAYFQYKGEKIKFPFETDKDTKKLKRERFDKSEQISRKY